MLLSCAAALLALAYATCGAGASPKILRLASADIETLDPQQYTDDPSFQVIQAIYEPAYEWDYLASPPRLTPLTAAAPPEIADGGTTWTVRIKPGIFFTDHPAFKGKPRELVAQDYVYAYKRWIDPNGRRGGSVLADLIVGARPVVDAAKRSGRFDFDRPIEGLRALERYTLQIRLTQANYPNVRDLIGFVGAVPREVVDAGGAQFRSHPVGTGPFMLREWKRGSRVVLEANPGYREAYFPRSADAALQKIMAGKRVPQIGVVEINFIEEDVTRLLQFEQGGLDYVALRGETANRLVTNGELKPEYAARGVTRQAFAEPFLFAAYFNMRDPEIGGMSQEHIALRRAIALGLDRRKLIDVVYAGQGTAANQLVPPGVGGHDPTLPAPAHDPAAARSLLDRFGYKLSASGYRSAPDGRPLTLTLSLRTGTVSREMQTLWRRDMDAIGLRTEFRLAPFQDVVKELEQGQFQIYFGGFGGSPSGYPEVLQLYSKQSPRLNVTHFALPEYDIAAEAFMRAANDAEQRTAARRMSELAAAYVPLLPLLFRVENDFVQPWVQGFRSMPFSSYWKYLDIDLALLERAKRK